LTSDIDDQVFRIDNPRFIPYYCGAKKLITVLMKLECRVCVMTMPDLEKYQYKRSIVNKNIEYIYMDHGFSSLTMVARKQAFDYFDTIFTYGKNVDKEIRAMEKFYGSKEKNLVGTGYDLFYKLEKNYVPVVNEKKTVILASSWQKDNIMESCLDDLVQSFEKLGYKVIIRPHPEFIKRFPQKIQKIKSKFPNELQLDFSVNIMNADVLVTDWSSIGWEFTYATNKPCIFINTPIKALNPDWDKYGIEPLEIFVRDKIGTAVDIADIKDMGAKIKAIEKITNPRKVIKDIMYDNSKANEIGGKYIIDAVKKERQ
jgi:YidC/Oxa1 family membrane protein insertase